MFTALALVTGSIWGKPMWGTWWVWDARLTSVFILFLMYLGIIALTRALDDPGRAAARRRDHHAGRLHQHPDHQVLGRLVEHAAPAGVGVAAGRADHRPRLLWPLLVMALGFTLLFFALHLMAMRTEILRRRVARADAAGAARKAERPRPSMHGHYAAFIARRLWALGPGARRPRLWVLLDGRAVRGGAGGAGGARPAPPLGPGSARRERPGAAGEPPRCDAAPPLLARGLPLLLFAALAGVFLYQLVSGHDPQAIPSALIGAKAPATNLPPLEGLSGRRRAGAGARPRRLATAG